MASVGLLELARPATSERRAEAGEGVTFLQTLAALQTRVGQAGVLLAVATVAAEFVGAMARDVLEEAFKIVIWLK